MNRYLSIRDNSKKHFMWNIKNNDGKNISGIELKCITKNVLIIPKKIYSLPI